MLPIADEVMEFEITSNRPDCLCVYGIAREVSAVARHRPGAVARHASRTPAGDGSVEDWVRRASMRPTCARAGPARVFTDVKVGPSPPWLKARITAAGMRPISNVVDITNYVMLCVGEPTHAFDLDKVTGREIIVRRAGDGERVVTLDGQERTLDADVLVIADAEKPSAIGGLMGSEWSEVAEQTTTVLLECANFDGPTIQRSSTRLGLRTEGSTPMGEGPRPAPAAAGAGAGLAADGGADGRAAGAGHVDMHGQLPEPPVVPLRRERLEQLIGVTYSRRRSTGCWRGSATSPPTGAGRCPTWRANDTTREVDLIEEVARIDGVWKVPTVMPPHADAIGKRDRMCGCARR